MTSEQNSAKVLFKSLALSFLIVGTTIIVILVGIGFFVIYAGNQFANFLNSIPIENTLAYGGFITAITYIKYRWAKPIAAIKEIKENFK